MTDAEKTQVGTQENWDEIQRKGVRAGAIYENLRPELEKHHYGKYVLIDPIGVADAPYVVGDTEELLDALCVLNEKWRGTVMFHVGFY